MFFDAIAWVSFAFCTVAIILFCHRAGQIYKVNNAYGDLWIRQRVDVVAKMIIVAVVSGCWLIWG